MNKIPVNNSSKDEINQVTTGAKGEWRIVLIILTIAILISVLLYLFKPVAEKRPVQAEPPLVEYVVAEEDSVEIPVFSQGSINPQIQIKLLAEISGRITQMAQLKLKGGFFNKEELLLKVDDEEYLLAITKARSLVSAAKQQLARVEAEAAQARYDLKQIGRSPSTSSAYALREPQLAEAKANMQAAEADLKIAQLQLQRTQVRAPFNGRVVNKYVDIGQYVSPGTVLADIYSTEAAEVRLPLSLQQIELLGIALRNDQQEISAISVVLSSDVSGKKFQWSARLSHTEGELDARNRLVYAVAKIEDPFVRDQLLPEKPPLIPGMFVKAILKGIAKNKVISLPRTALRYGDEVYVLNAQDELEIKKVALYAKDRLHVYVKSGLIQGDRVITSAIDYPVEGMKLSIDKLYNANNI